MSFDTSAYLRRATGRAKSDVANKLVSMFLHDVSRRLCNKLELSVNDPRYAEAVAAAFGTACCYCGKPLEGDRAAVEHLDGMNRFQMGLHIPGNVIVSCTRCNREKRRDDSLAELILAKSGWESFLCHHSRNCKEGCNSCTYWSGIWPDEVDRFARLGAARDKILGFRAIYAPYLELNARARPVLAARIHAIYRECQDFASTRIKTAGDDVIRELFQAEPVGGV
jgi:hypothetical protein